MDASQLLGGALGGLTQEDEEDEDEDEEEQSRLSRSQASAGVLAASPARSGTRKRLAGLSPRGSDPDVVRCESGTTIGDSDGNGWARSRSDSVDGPIAGGNDLPVQRVHSWQDLSRNLSDRSLQSAAGSSPCSAHPREADEDCRDQEDADAGLGVDWEWEEFDVPREVVAPVAAANVLVPEAWHIPSAGILKFDLVTFEVPLLQSALDTHTDTAPLLPCHGRM